MSPPLTIPIDALERGPFHLQGELPGSLLDLEQEVSIRNVGAVRYDLTAERMNQEVLVRGTLEVSMELECVRSGLFFSTMVRDSAFLRDYSLDLPGGDLDISEDVREALVIEIPSYPVSPEADSEEFTLPSLPGEWTDDRAPPDADDNPWNDLDQLNVEK